LQADFGFVHFERARGRNGVASCGADEVTNQADVRVEEFGIGRSASKYLSLSGLRGAGSGEAEAAAGDETVTGSMPGSTGEEASKTRSSARWPGDLVSRIAFSSPRSKVTCSASVRT